jgi:hypothetical protein
MESGQLGAYLFFDRDAVERRNPTTVIRTLAYQLVLSDRKIGTRIKDAIEANPRIINSSFRLQFMRLLTGPLSSADVSAEASLVVILDALDECGTPEQSKGLLKVLAEETAKLPLFIHILITGRWEHNIADTLELQAHIRVQQLNLSSANNNNDISLFFRCQMAEIHIKNKCILGDHWPGDVHISDLTHRASGLFAWASTALGFLDRHDAPKCLQILLKKEATLGAESGLDALYTTALESIGNWDDDDFVKDFQNILGCILALRTSLLGSAIDTLFGISEDRPCMHTVEHLACVLTQDPTVHVLHPSFADFLLYRTRCVTDMWFIDTSPCNHHLALGCLSFLQQTLTTNICGLVLAKEWVGTCLPEDISYACLFWIHHVCAVDENVGPIMNILDQFIFLHLLHWLEVMSILKKSRETTELLDRLHSWLSVSRSLSACLRLNLIL